MVLRVVEMKTQIQPKVPAIKSSFLSLACRSKYYRVIICEDND